MPPSVGAVLTAPLVGQFRAEFPGVSLGVMEDFSGHVLEWLTTGRIGVAPNVQVEIDAMPSTLSLVEGGSGYTILSYSSAHDLIEAGRIRKWAIVDPMLTRSLVVATSTQRPATKAARALVGFVRKQVDALVAQGRWAPSRR